MVHDCEDSSGDAGIVKKEVFEDRTTVHTVEKGQGMIATPKSYWWYCDTASDSQSNGDRSFFVAFTEYVTNMQSVHGGTLDLVSRIAGVGTVAVITKRLG